MTQTMARPGLERGSVGSERRSGAVNALQALLHTRGGVAPALLRITLALVIFPHGAQKLFGWFGGYGFEGTMGFLTQGLGIPWVFALAAILAESIGALALAAGLLTRIAAAAIGVVMTVAALTTHLSNGFFMDWGGTMQVEGFEFHILALGIALAVTILGGGSLSADRSLARRLAG